MSSFQESQMSREELLEQITKMIEQMPLDKLYECAELLGIEEDEYFKEHGCNMCRGYFDAGKDNCKKCGLDLNCFNKDEEDEDEDPKTKPCSCGCDVIGGSCEEVICCFDCKNDDEEEGLYCNGENWFCSECWAKK